MSLLEDEKPKSKLTALKDEEKEQTLRSSPRSLTLTHSKHSYNEREVAVVIEWVKALMAPYSSDPEFLESISDNFPIKSSENLFKLCSNGPFIGYLIYEALKDINDEDNLELKKRLMLNKIETSGYQFTNWKSMEILSAAFEVLKQIGVLDQISTLGVTDLVQGVPHLCLAFLWQLYKYKLLSPLNVVNSQHSLLSQDNKLFSSRVRNHQTMNNEVKLIIWANGKLLDFDRRVKNLSGDFKDGSVWLLLLNSVGLLEQLPDYQPTEDLKVLEERIELLTKVLKPFNLDSMISLVDMVNGNRNLNLALLASLYHLENSERISQVVPNFDGFIKECHEILSEHAKKMSELSKPLAAKLSEYNEPTDNTSICRTMTEVKTFMSTALNQHVRIHSRNFEVINDLNSKIAQNDLATKSLEADLRSMDSRVKQLMANQEPRRITILSNKEKDSTYDARIRALQILIDQNSASAKVIEAKAEALEESQKAINDTFFEKMKVLENLQGKSHDFAVSMNDMSAFATLIQEKLERLSIEKRLLANQTLTQDTTVSQHVITDQLAEISREVEALSKKQRSSKLHEVQTILQKVTKDIDQSFKEKDMKAMNLKKYMEHYKKESENAMELSLFEWKTRITAMSADYESHIHTLEKETTEMRNRMADVLADAKVNSERLHEMQLRLEKSEEKVVNLTQQVQQVDTSPLEDRERIQTDDISAITEIYDELLSEITKQLNQQMAEYNRLEKTNEQLISDLESYGIKLVRKQEAVDDALFKLQSMKNEYSRLADNFNALEAEKIALKDKLKAHQEVIHQLEQRIYETSQSTKPLNEGGEESEYKIQLEVLEKLAQDVYSEATKLNETNQVISEDLQKKLLESVEKEKKIEDITKEASEKHKAEVSALTARHNLKVNALNQELDANKAKVIELEGELQIKDAESKNQLKAIANLEATIAAREKELQTLKSSKEAMELNIQDLHSQITTLNQNINMRDDKLRRALGSTVELGAASISLYDKAGQMIDQEREEHQLQLQTLAAINSELQSIISQKVIEYQTLQAELMNLKEVQENNNLLNTRISLLESELAAAVLDVAYKTEKISKLENAQPQREPGTQNITELESKVSELNALNTLLQAQSEAWEKTRNILLERQENQSKELIELQSKNHATTEELNALKGAYSELENNLGSKLLAAEAQISASDSFKSKLQQDHEDLKALFEEKNRLLDEITSQNQTLRLELNSSRNHSVKTDEVQTQDDLFEDVIKHAKELQVMQSALEASELKVQQANSNRKAQIEASKALEDLLSQERVDKLALQDEIKRLQQEVEGMKSAHEALESTRSENISLKNEIQSRNLMLENANLQIQSLSELKSKALQDLESTKAEFEKKLVESAVVYEAIKADISGKSVDTVGLKSIVDNLESQCSNLKIEKQEVEGKLKEAIEVCESLETQLVSAAESKIVLQRSFDERVGELNGIIDKLSSELQNNQETISKLEEKLALREESFELVNSQSKQLREEFDNYRSKSRLDEEISRKFIEKLEISQSRLLEEYHSVVQKNVELSNSAITAPATAVSVDTVTQTAQTETLLKPKLKNVSIETQESLMTLIPPEKSFDYELSYHLVNNLNNRLKSEGEHYKASIANYSEIIRGFQSQLSEYKEMNLNLSMEKQQIQAQLLQAGLQITELEIAEKNAKNEAQKLASTQGKMQDQIYLLQTHVKEIESEKEALVSRLSTLSSIKDVKFKASSSRLYSAVEERQSEVESLKSQVADLEKKLIKSEDAKNAAIKNYEETREKEESLRSKVHAMSILQIQHQNLLDRTKILENQILSLQQSIQAKEKTFEADSAMAAKDLLSYKMKCDLLQSQLHSAEDANETLSAKADQYLVKFQDLRMKLHIAETEIAEMKASQKIEKYSSKSNLYKEQVRISIPDLSTVQNLMKSEHDYKVQELNEKIEALTKQNQIFNDTLKDYQSIIESSQVLRDNLNSQLAHSQAQCAALEKEVSLMNVLETTVEELHNKIQFEMKSKDEVISAKQALDQSFNMLEERNKLLVLETESIKEERDAIKKDNEKLETVIQDLNNQIKDFQKRESEILDIADKRKQLMVEQELKHQQIVNDLHALLEQGIQSKNAIETQKSEIVNSTIKTQRALELKNVEIAELKKHFEIAKKLSHERDTLEKECAALKDKFLKKKIEVEFLTAQIDIQSAQYMAGKLQWLNTEKTLNQLLAQKQNEIASLQESNALLDAQAKLNVKRASMHDVQVDTSDAKSFEPSQEIQTDNSTVAFNEEIAYLEEQIKLKDQENEYKTKLLSEFTNLLNSSDSDRIQLERKCEEWMKTCHELELDRNVFDKKCVVLESEVADLRNQLDSFTKSNNTSALKIEELLEQIKEKDENASRLKLLYETKEAENAKSRALYEILTKGNKVLKQSLETMQEEQQTSETEISRLRKQYEQLQSENSTLNDQYVKSKDDAFNNLTKPSERQKKEFEEFRSISESQVRELQSQKQALELNLMEKNGLLKQKEEYVNTIIQKYDKDRSTLETKIDLYINRNSEIHKEAASLKAELEELRLAYQTRDVVQPIPEVEPPITSQQSEQTDQLRVRVAQLEFQLSNTTAVLENYKEKLGLYDSQVVELKQRVKDKDNTMKTLENILSIDREEKKSLMENSAKRSNDLKQSNHDLKEQINQLSKELEASRSNEENLRKELANSIKTVQELRTSLEKLQADIVQERSWNAEISKKLEEVSKDLEVQRSENHDLQFQKDLLETSIIAKDKYIENLNNRISELQSSIEQQSQTAVKIHNQSFVYEVPEPSSAPILCNQITQTLIESDSDIIELKSQMEAAQRAISEYKSRRMIERELNLRSIKRLEIDNQALKSNLDALTADKVGLEKLAKMLSAEKDQLYEQIDSLKLQVLNKPVTAPVAAVQPEPIVIVNNHDEEIQNYKSTIEMLKENDRTKSNEIAVLRKASEDYEMLLEIETKDRLSAIEKAENLKLKLQEFELSAAKQLKEIDSSTETIYALKKVNEEYQMQLKVLNDIRTELQSVSSDKEQASIEIRSLKMRINDLEQFSARDKTLLSIKDNRIKELMKQKEAVSVKNSAENIKDEMVSLIRVTSLSQNQLAVAEDELIQLRMRNQALNDQLLESERTCATLKSQLTRTQGDLQQYCTEQEQKMAILSANSVKLEGLNHELNSKCDHYINALIELRKQFDAHEIVAEVQHEIPKNETPKPEVKEVVTKDLQTEINAVDPALEELISRKQNKIEALERQVEILKKANADQKLANNVFQSYYDTLKEKLASRDEEVSGLRAEIERAVERHKNEVSSLRNEIDSKFEASARLESVIKQLEMQLQDSQSSLLEARHQVDLKGLGIIDLEENITKMRQDHQNQIAQLQEKLERQQEAYEINIQALRDGNQRKVEEIEQKRASEVASLQNKITEISIQQQESKQNVENRLVLNEHIKIKGLEKDFSAVVAEFEEYRQRSKKESEEAKMKHSLQVNLAESKIFRLESELNESSKQIMKQKDDLAKLEERVSALALENRKSIESIELSKLKIQQRDTDIEELRKRLNEKQSIAVDPTPIVIQDTAPLKETISSLTSEKMILQTQLESLQSSINVLSSNNEEYKGIIQKQMSQIEEILSVKELARLKAIDSEKEVRELESQVSQLNPEIKELKAARDKAAEENRLYVAKFKELNDEIATLKSEKDILDQRLKSLNRSEMNQEIVLLHQTVAMSELEKHIADLEVQAIQGKEFESLLKQATSKLKEKEIELNALTAKVSDLEMEAKSLVTENEEHVLKASSLESKLQDHLVETNKLKLEKERNEQNAAKELKQQAFEIELLHVQNEKLISQLSDSDFKAKTATEQLIKYKQLIDSLESELLAKTDTIKNYQETIEGFKSNIQTLQSRTPLVLEVGKDELKAKENRIRDLERENNELKAEAALLNETIRLHKERVNYHLEQHQLDRDSYLKSQEKITDLQKELEIKTAEAEEFALKAKLMEMKYEESSAKLNDTSDELKRLTSVNASLMSNITELKLVPTAIMEENEDLKSRIQLLQKENQELIDTKENQNHELEIYKAGNASLKNLEANLKKQLQDVQAEKVLLDKEHQSLLERFRQVSEKSFSEEQKILELNGALDLSIKDKEDLNAKLKDTEKQRLESAGQLKELREKHLQLLNEFESSSEVYDKQLRELKVKLEESTAANTALESSNLEALQSAQTAKEQSYRQEIQTSVLEMKLRSLTNDNDMLQSKCEFLSLELDQMNARCSDLEQKAIQNPHMEILKEQNNTLITRNRESYEMELRLQNELLSLRSEMVNFQSSAKESQLMVNLLKAENEALVHQVDEFNYERTEKDKLKTLIEGITKEKEQLLSEVANQKSVIQTLGTEKEKFENRAVLLTNEKGMHEAVSHAAREKLIEVQEKLSKLEQENSRLNTELESLRAVKSEKEALATLNIQLKDDNTGLNRRAFDQAVEIRNQSVKVQELSAEIEKIRAEFREKEEATSKLESELIKSNKSLSELQLRQSKIKFESEYKVSLAEERFNAVLEELEQNKKLIAILQAQSKPEEDQEITEQIQALHEKMQAIYREREEAKGALSIVQSTYSNLDFEKHQLEIQLQHTQKSLEDTTVLSDEQSMQIKLLKSRNSFLESMTKELASKVERNLESVKEVTALQNEERTKYQSEKQTYQNEIERLKKSQEASNGRISEQAAEINRCGNVIKDLEMLPTLLRNELESAQLELRTAKVQVSKLSAKVEKSTKELSVAETEARILSEKLNDQNASFNQMRVRCNALAEEANNKDLMIKSHKEEIQRLGHEVKSITEKLIEQNQKHHLLQVEHQETVESSKALQAEFEKVKAANKEQNQNQLNIIKALKEQVEFQKTNFENETANLVEGRENSIKEINALKLELETLKNLMAMNLIAQNEKDATIMDTKFQLEAAKNELHELERKIQKEAERALTTTVLLKSSLTEKESEIEKMRKEEFELQAELTKVGHENGLLLEAKTSLNEELASAYAANRDSSIKIRELQDHIQELDSKLQSNRVELQEKSSLNKQQESRIELLELEARNLKDELDKTCIQFTNSENRANLLEQDNMTMKRTMEENDNQSRSLKEKLSALEAQSEAFEKNKEELMIRTQELANLSSIIKDYKGKEVVHDDTISSLKSQIENYERKIESLHNEANELQQTIAQRNSYIEQLQLDLTKKISTEVADQDNQLLLQNQNLQNQYKDLQQSSSNIIHSLENKIEYLNAEIASFKQKHLNSEEISLQLSTQFEHLNHSLREATAEKQKVEVQMKNLSSRLEDMEYYRKQLKEDLAKITDKNQALMLSLDANVLCIKQKESAMTSLSEQNHRLNESIKGLKNLVKANTEQYELQIQEMISKHMLLNREHEELKSRFGTVESKMKEFQKQCEEFQQEKQLLDNQVSNKNDEIRRLETANRQFDSKLESKSNECTVLIESLESLKAHNVEVQDTNRFLMSEIERLKSHVSTNEELIRTFQKASEENASSLRAREKALLESSALIIDLQNQVEFSRASIVEFKSSIDSLQKEKDELSVASKSLSEKTSMLEECVKSLNFSLLDQKKLYEIKVEEYNQLLDSHRLTVVEQGETKALNSLLNVRVGKLSSELEEKNNLVVQQQVLIDKLNGQQWFDKYMEQVALAEKLQDSESSQKVVIQSLKEALSEAEKTNALFKNEVESLREKDSELKQLEDNYNFLFKRFQSLETEQQNTRSENESLVESNKRNLENIHNLETLNRLRDNEITSLRDELTNSELANFKMTSRLQICESELQQRKDQDYYISNIEKEIESLRQKFQTEEAELSQEKAKRVVANETEHNLKARLDLKERELKELNETRIKLQQKLNESQKEIDDLNTELKERSKKIDIISSNAENEARESALQILKLQEKVDVLTSSIEKKHETETSDKIRNALAEINDLGAIKEVLLSEISNLNDIIRIKDENNDSIKQELQETLAKLDDYARKISVFELKEVHLTEQIRDKQLLIETETLELNRKNNQISELIMAKADLERDKESLHSRADFLIHEIEELKAIINTAKADAKESDRKQEELNMSYRLKVEQCEKLESEKARLAEESSSLHSKLRALEGQLQEKSKLPGILSRENQLLAAENEASRAKELELRKQVSQFESKIEALENQLQSLAELAKENEKQKSQLEKLEKALKSSEDDQRQVISERMELRKEFDTYKASRESVENELHEKIRQKALEIESKANSFQTLFQEHKDLTERQNNLLKTLETVEKEKKALQKDFDVFKHVNHSKLQKKELEVAQLEKELEELNDDLNRVKKHQNELLETNLKFEEREASLKTTIEKDMNMIEQQKRTIDELLAKRDSDQQTIHALSERVKSLNDSAVELDLKLQDSHSKFRHLNEQFVLKDEDCMRLRRELASVTDEKERLQNANQEMEVKNSQLQKDLVTSEEQLEETRRQATSLSQSLNVANNDIANLKAKIQDLQYEAVQRDNSLSVALVRLEATDSENTRLKIKDALSEDTIKRLSKVEDDYVHLKTDHEKLKLENQKMKIRVDETVRECSLRLSSAETSIVSLSSEKSSLLTTNEHLKTELKLIFQKEKTFENREKAYKREYESAVLEFTNQIKMHKDNAELLRIKLKTIEEDYTIQEVKLKTDLERFHEYENLINCLKEENKVYKEKHDSLLQKINELNNTASLKDVDWIHAKEKYYKELLKVLQRETKQLDTINDLSNRIAVKDDSVTKYSNFQIEQELKETQFELTNTKDKLKLSNEKCKRLKMQLEELAHEQNERDQLHMAKLKELAHNEDTLRIQIQELKEELLNANERNEHHLKMILGVNQKEQPIQVVQPPDSFKEKALSQELEAKRNRILELEEQINELSVSRARAVKEIETLKRENYKLNRKVQSQDVQDPLSATQVLKELDDEWFTKFKAIEEELEECKRELQKSRKGEQQVELKQETEESNNLVEWMYETIKQYGLKVPSDFRVNERMNLRLLKELNQVLRQWLRMRSIEFKVPYDTADTVAVQIQELGLLHQAIYQNVYHSGRLDETAINQGKQLLNEFYESEYNKLLQTNRALVAKLEEITDERNTLSFIENHEPKWSMERKDCLNKIQEQEETIKKLQDLLNDKKKEDSMQGTPSFLDFKLVLSDVLIIPVEYSSFSNELAIFIRRSISSLNETLQLQKKEIAQLQHTVETMKSSISVLQGTNREIEEELLKHKMQKTAEVPETMKPLGSESFSFSLGNTSLERELVHYKEKDKHNTLEKNHFLSEIFHLSNDRKQLLRKIQELQSKNYELQQSISFYQVEASKLSEMDCQLEEVSQENLNLSKKLSTELDKSTMWLIDLKALISLTKNANEMDMDDAILELSNLVTTLNVKVSRLEKERNIWFDDYQRQKEANVLLIQELTEMRLSKFNKSNK